MLKCLKWTASRPPDGFASSKSLCSATPNYAPTAQAMGGSREQCLAAGMTGYVSKPLQPQELFSALDQLLHAGSLAE